MTVRELTPDYRLREPTLVDDHKIIAVIKVKGGPISY